MHKRILSAGMLLSGIFLASAGAFAQERGQPQQSAQPAARLTIGQLTTAAKHYFRDTVEFPLLQKMTFTVSDSSGRVRRVQNISVEYVFNGYNPGKQTARGQLHGQISMWAAMTGAKLLKTASNSGIWSMFAGQVLLSNSGSYSFEADETGNGEGLLTAKLVHVQPCPAVTMNQKSSQLYRPDGICGSGKYQLHQDLSFQKFTFDVSGLPAPLKIDPFGRCMLRRYHVEVEFQEVMLLGDKEPFLVPKQVTATLETDKGNVVIASVYEPRSERAQ